MRKLACMVVLVSLLMSGCSIYMAASRSTKQDVTCIREGEHRDVIIAQLGEPDTSMKMESGGYKDYYKIATNAHSEGGKTAAVIGHATMDVLTLGLWEIIGTPLELAAQDKITTFILVYDYNGLLASYETIKAN